MRKGLHIHAQEFLSQDAHQEGNHRHRNADDRHFQEPGTKGLILRHRRIVCKGSNDHHDNAQHAQQGIQPLGRREQQKRQNQCRAGEKICADAQARSVF